MPGVNSRVHDGSDEMQRMLAIVTMEPVAMHLQRASIACSPVAIGTRAVKAKGAATVYVDTS